MHFKGFFSTPLLSRGNLVIITLDCVRPDFLGCYGCESVRTPTLDRLARGGVVFEQAITQAPNTWVSHAGLFTGLYPPRHGLRSPYDRLSPEVPTLASLLARQGYATAGFPGCDLAGSRMGLDQGFQFFPEAFLDTGTDGSPVDGGSALLCGAGGGGERLKLTRALYDASSAVTGPAALGRLDPPFVAASNLAASPGARPRQVDRGEARGVAPSDSVCGRLLSDRAPPVSIQGRSDWGAVLNQARDWLLPRAGPVFLWFHYLETHHLPSFDLPDYYRFSRDPLWQFYEGKVSYADGRCVAAVIDLLREWGGFEDTLIVVLADHGESLIPGRPPLHNGELSEEVLRVPLVFYCARAAWNGVRIPLLVRTADMVPALLELLCGPGSSAPEEGLPEFSGVPLSRLGRESPGAERTRAAGDFAYAENGPLGHYCLRTREWKLTVRPQGETLVHLPTDPGERSNVLARHPRTAAYLREELEGVRDSARLAPELPADREVAETRRLLRSFGYLD